MRNVLAGAGRLFDFAAQLVLVAVLVAACGVAEWLLVPMACWTQGAEGGVFVIAVLTLAGLAAVLLCCPMRLP